MNLALGVEEEAEESRHELHFRGMLWMDNREGRERRNHTEAAGGFSDGVRNRFGGMR